MGKMYIIGIAGGSGAGKTTFAEKIIKQLPEGLVSLIHMDSYYLNEVPKQLYTKKNIPNYDHPGAFDWELLSKHMKEIKAKNDIETPIYDFKENNRMKASKLVSSTKVVLFEGIFALYDPNIRNLLDIKCFLHVDADIRFTRRLHRDVNDRGRSLDSVISQYYDTVRPMYIKYLDPQKQYADFTVGEETDIAASILSAKINQLLG
jgi:uridine kinase